MLFPWRGSDKVQVYFGVVLRRGEEPRTPKGYDSSGSDCKPEVWTGR